MSNKKNIFSSLYWKISAIFLLLLIVIGFAYVKITVDTTQAYFQEKNQKLNITLAEHLVSEVKPTYVDGKVNEAAMDKIMHSMMATNPSIEVYLLDNHGKILNYVAPYKKVKLKSVNLSPIQEFLKTKGETFVKGDDPRNANLQKEFSVAPVLEEGKKVGYVYVVLASEEYDMAASDVIDGYIMRLGGKTMLLTLGTALIVGLLLIWLITRNLNTIIETVKKFKNGDLEARIPIKSNGELSELSTTFNDMADTILQNIDKMKASENLRRELVANVSHDLRTPLAVIHGYIETLMIKEESITKAENKKYLNTILQSTEKLKKLVEDLFELSKLEAKEIEPHKEPFFITELIQDISQKHKLLAQEKNITIVPAISEDIPMVHADVSLIERVLQNLIDNAIKFTEDGGIITIETHQLEKNVEIKVSDTGVGISESEIPYVFDRYHALSKDDNSESNIDSRKVSTGLGLAIVKKILEIHNATINLTSKLNHGSSFSFNLPVYQR